MEVFCKNKPEKLNPKVCRFTAARDFFFLNFCLHVENDVKIVKYFLSLKGFAANTH